MTEGARDAGFEARINGSTGVSRRLVVLGIGNTLLTDDGAGVQAIQRMRADTPDAAMDFIDGGTLNFTLLPFLENAPALIVIDAAELGAAPGTVRVYEGEAMDCIVGAGRRRSVHEAGLADVMAMARLQDCLPERRALISVQPERIDWGETLSPAVAGALPDICKRTRLLAQRWAP